MDEISAPHRYNCDLQSDIKPLKMYNVICHFSLSSILPPKKKKSTIKALGFRERGALQHACVKAKK